jgi:hypothetical protein
MDPGIQFADLLAYNAAESTHWKRGFADHPAALDLACDVAGAGTVRNLMFHVFTTEMFFANHGTAFRESISSSLPAAHWLNSLRSMTRHTGNFRSFWK